MATTRERPVVTDSGIAVEPVYRAEDAGAPEPDPGAYPYTRGVYPTMYRGRLWTMRQYAGFASARESNQRYRYLLEQGQTGLSVAFDLPTQLGLDSDDPRAEGEVGKVGVAIDSLRDMETLFDDIPLDKVTTSMTINAPASVLLLLYELVAEGQGVSPDKIGGTIQNDILKEYVARGTYIFPPRPSMRLITDIFAYCAERMPRLEHDQHQRLPHPRGRGHGGAGDRLHPGRRHRLRGRGDRGRARRGRPSPRGSPSSSSPTRTSWRRWPSSAPPGGSGRRS